MGSRLIGASDDGERPTSPSNPHASPREPPHSWFSFSLSYIPSISSPPIARAVRGTRHTMRWKLVKQRISIRGGYGSRCDVCLRVVILTILPLSTSPPPSCTIPCGIVTLVQIKKKRFVPSITCTVGHFFSFNPVFLLHLYVLSACPLLNS